MIEVRIQSIIKIINRLPTTSAFKKCVPATNAQLSIQTQITSARTRRNVTTCLYLSPSIRASSLSTLIAVEVSIDTVVKTTVELKNTLYDIPSKLMSGSFIQENRAIAKSGCEISPTQRSVTARHRNCKSNYSKDMVK